MWNSKRPIQERLTKRVMTHVRSATPGSMYPARRVERICRFVMAAALIYMAVLMVMFLQIRLNAF